MGFFSFFQKHRKIIFFCLFLMYREFMSINGLKESWYAPEQQCSSVGHIQKLQECKQMNIHSLVKLILFILVKLLSPSPLYHPSVLLWRMRQRCSLDSHKPQHTASNFFCTSEPFVEQTKPPLSALELQLERLHSLKYE